MRLAVVSSVGGHLTDLLRLCRAFEGCERFWIINDDSPVLPEHERAYIITHAERDWRLLRNVVEVASVFERERPDLVLSTGASPAVPAALVGRCIGIPIIYVEPLSSVTQLTLTGRLMRFLATTFYVQWEPLLSIAPWAKFGGTSL